MTQLGVGVLPVWQDGQPVGVVMDRDICCRASRSASVCEQKDQSSLIWVNSEPTRRVRVGMLLHNGPKKKQWLRPIRHRWRNQKRCEVASVGGLGGFASDPIRTSGVGIERQACRFVSIESMR